MTQDEIIEMARQAELIKTIDCCGVANKFCSQDQWKGNLSIFAKLVAQHTLANIDPSKFISFQEGVETGRLAEREACAKIVDEFCYGSTKILVEKAIRARGQA